MPRPVAYILTSFPQLSETFIENEIRALHRLGDEVVAHSIYRPPAELAGSTSLGADRLFYRPGPARIALCFMLAAIRHPVVMARNLWRAVAMRSMTMLRGVALAPWMAANLRPRDVRHVHAHFALDAACAGRVVADLLGVGFTYTLHAHEIYMRNRTLCSRVGFADTLVTVCEYNVDQLVQRCPAAGDAPIEIVFCGVDPEQFTPRSWPAEAPARFELLSVGRLVDQKGFDDLIAAVAVVTSRGHRLRLRIVGRGPLHDELAAQIAGLGLNDVVELTGPRPPDEVAALLAETDVFVLACKVADDANRDSMPVVLKEAMAAGVPVVGTEEVAIPEMVDDAVGRLAPPRDPAALAAAIESLLTSTQAERAALGAAGRARVEQQFNLYTETAKLRAVFDAVGETS